MGFSHADKRLNEGDITAVKVQVVCLILESR